MKYDYLVFIGRFQPFHKGHEEVVNRALEMSERVIMLVGGFGKPRSPRNPWTFEERRDIIRAVYNNDRRLIIQPIKDYTYNDNLWLEEVQNKVKELVLDNGTSFNPDGMNDYKIGLIGCEKDHTSYYINLFPQWGNEAVKFVNPINATDIRKILFEDQEIPTVYLPDAVIDYLSTDPVAPSLVKEYNYYQNYKKAFNNNPYPTQHLTADALVIQSGHVLLIKRRSEPGKGLWALPGGFKHHTETFKQAALRELKEETKLKVPLPVLEGSITETFIADAPHRSERGTVVSQVFKIMLKAGELPKVKGSDDAMEAKWVLLADVRESEMFEDHYHIIRELV